MKERNQMTHPGGRPTKLTPELIAKANDYIQGGYLIDELVPTIAGLGVFLDIRRSTVYEWAKESKEFSDILDRVMQKQEKGLLKGGIEGTYNSTITKLMLTKHNYSDKQETALTGADGGPVQLQEIKREIVDPKH
jgi:hypothetical protein